MGFYLVPKMLKKYAFALMSFKFAKLYVWDKDSAYDHLARFGNKMCIIPWNNLFGTF